MTRRALIGGIVCCIYALFLSSTPASLGDAGLLVERQALLLLKALSYDRTLAERAGGALRIAIVYKRQHRQSLQQATMAAEAFAKLEKLTIQRMPLAASLVEYAGVPELERWLEMTQHNTLYLAPGLEEELEAILTCTHSRKLNVITGVRAYVSRGATVGVVMEGVRPKILLNLKAAIRHGNDFSSQLFKVAELVRGD